MNMFITGVRGDGDAKQIRVHERGKPDPVWTWSPRDAEKLMTEAERTEFAAVLQSMRKGSSITEFKWAAGGTKIAAIVGWAAVLIGYPSKKLLFGNANETSMHSLEVLPGNKLALVTSGASQSDGVWVFDTSRKVADQPIQKLPGLPSGHALVWDQAESMLWAAGTDIWPETTKPVRGRLVGYKYDGKSAKPLSYSADRDYTMREAGQLKDEYPAWKEGPHDLAPVPDQRKILIATDLSIYEFDLSTKKFKYDIADTYFNGFISSPERGEKKIPRSGLKSLSLSSSGGDYVYLANDWKGDFSKQVRFFRRGEKKPGETVQLPSYAYKARWFYEMPGWPTAR
ncbi:DUF6528 family protein [Streptomyces caeruleatus]|uniref:WD40 repeat domain-containing protein n=1 Tax=Streptomyces caeruleatus TaxID=661399 RepID=A0A101TWN8_9ACTN|nr:DUF6528 family protein [Streptomyces caeruleatus]KUO00025.1 hypothetical protein AQJ67_24455 [Streptomyces caeruleatus]